MFWQSFSRVGEITCVFLGAVSVGSHSKQIYIVLTAIVGGQRLTSLPQLTHTYSIGQVI